MGSPVVRMSRKTSVTRMKMVGKMSRNRTRMYRPRLDPPWRDLRGVAAEAGVVAGSSVRAGAFRRGPPEWER
jgi:hypothetical protein